MWHEARKHEKKIRGIMIDHRRRAEKKREFYESIRQDPALYLQIHGQQMKIYIDPIISQAAESSLVPWMGNQTNMIDRFDARTNLDYIPTAGDVGGSMDNNILTSDQECQLNYERFRNLVQNDFLGNSEQKVLHQIFQKERWGQQQNNLKTKNELKKKLVEKKAAIGYNYDDMDKQTGNDYLSEDSEESDEDEEFEDLDTIVFVDKLDPDMCQRLNVIAKKYGVKSGSFIKFMQADEAEADRLRIAKEIESEKSMFVGRKSRRERKVLIQQRLLILRSINNEDCEVDHFGGEGMTKQIQHKSESDSSSESSENENSKSEPEEMGKIEFITSFGNDENDDNEDDKHSKRKKLDKKPNKELKKKLVKEKLKQMKKANESVTYGPSLPSNILDADTKDIDDVHFNSTNNLSKTRRYRFNKVSDDDKFSVDKSPPRPVRRSPSVRRRHSSEDSSSDDYYRKRSRSRSYERKRLSPPTRYRRSRSRSRDRNRRRSRSRSPCRFKRHSDYHEHSRHVSNRSRSRRSKERHQFSRDKRSKSPTFHRKSSHSRSRNERKRRSSTKSPIRKDNEDRSKRNTNDKLKTDDDNYKLYKLLEKIETSTKKKNSELQSNENPVKKEMDVPAVSSSLPLPETIVEKEKSPPIKRYYRHDLAKSDTDSDEDLNNYNESKLSERQNVSTLSASSKTDLNNQTKLSATNLTPATMKNTYSTNITPQERLKRLMKAQLDKQYKLDKKAEIDKMERQKLEELVRKEELSKLTSKMRKRRSMSRSSYSSNSSPDRSYERRRQRINRDRYSRSKSRSVSRSRSRSRSKSRYEIRRSYRRSRSKSIERSYRSRYQRSRSSSSSK